MSEDVYVPPTPALRGAWRKGYLAADGGKSRTCPYPDKRGGEHGHVITFSRSFRRAWFEGYDAFADVRRSPPALQEEET